MKLLEFPHSHYCEKARWALDYKGLAFQAIATMPGYHRITVRKYAPDTSVPVLINGDEAVQSSSEIIDYLEQKHPSRPLTPTNANELCECQDIERRMDQSLGVNIRQILYATLLDHPEFLRYCFTHPMPWYKQQIFRLIYPYLRGKIYQGYVISDNKVEQAKYEFDKAMTELEQRLENKQYLVSNTFTRADLSVASMLSWLVMPAEHPFPWVKIPDTRANEFCAQYKNHAVSEWVRTMYRDHRCPVRLHMKS